MGFSTVADDMGLGASQFGESEGNYIGALQFWGYALISGSADGSVRMWDSASFSLLSFEASHERYSVRTGQSHRTLMGHTSTINVLQFDETHVVTGSGDKTIRVSGLGLGSERCSNMEIDLGSPDRHDF